MNWTMNEMMELSTGYWRAGALIAAVDLELFAALGDGGATAEEVARELELSERHVAALLTALAGMKLVRLRAGRYSLVPEAAPFLAPDGEMCLLDSLRFNKDLYMLWGRLAETIRSGRPAIPPGAHLGMDAERTRRFVRGMHSRALGLAPALLPVLRAPPRGHLLDVASGPGTFSRLLAEQYPDLTVTQMDLPDVIEVARELTASSPAADRIRFMPGNYHETAMNGPYDAALFCGALHQEPPDDAQQVIHRILRAMRPGGRLIIADLMLDGDHTKPAFAALFGLTMMLTSPSGGVYSTDKVRGMLRAAGVGDIEGTIAGDLPYRVISGRKPDHDD